MIKKMKIAEACEQVFGISVRQYQRLVKEHGAPQINKGMIDLYAASSWLISYHRELAIIRLS